MNFFEHQDEAKRNTTRLVLLFVLAVVLIIASLYLVLVALLHFTLEQRPDEPLVWWQPDLLAYVTVGGLLLIGGGSLFKTAALSSGGSAVAEMLGGRLVDPSSSNPAERQLLNVVEEMSIASGTPVPQVFVMDGEAGINAFAAGHTIDDAAVAVTSGCLHQLTRDELQGVIAHEFSHVLNGDMRLNIRLIGVLQGILVIASIGYILLRAGSYSSIGRSRDREGGGIAIAIMLGGVAMLVIGYTGVMIGRLIKSAVSRQREFLADASAVQFTRNPSGIGRALAKIGGFDHGSKIANPHAEEASHLFFENAVKVSMFESMLSTHPPLDERIRRIDPSLGAALELNEEGPVRRAAFGAEPAMAGVMGFSGNHSLSSDLHGVVDRVGTPDAEHLSHGAAVLRAIPQGLREAAHELLGAVSIVYALLLDRDAEQRERQLTVLREREGSVVLSEALHLLPRLDELAPELRLPLVEACAPVLRQLSSEQREHFGGVIEALVAADQKTTVFEFALKKTVTRGLQAASGRRHRAARFSSIQPLKQDVAVLLSVVARAGVTEQAEPHRAFAAGLERIAEFSKAEPQLLPASACKLGVLDQALERLAGAAPSVKARVLDATAHVVLADRVVTLGEAELVRAVAHSLECPLPPFLPGTNAAGAY